MNILNEWITTENQMWLSVMLCVDVFAIFAEMLEG
jgi:hypothetical protein